MNGSPSTLESAAWTAVSVALLCLTWIGSPYLALPALVALLWALRDAAPRRALYIGLAVGALQTVVLAGIAKAGAVLFVALVAVYALAGAGFAVGVALLAPRAAGLGRSAGIAAVGCVVEWLHAQLPYGAANLMGDSQHAGPFLPLARVAGSYGVGFALLFAAGCVVTALCRLGEAGRAPRRWRAALALLPAALLLVVGNLWALLAMPVQQGTLRVAAIQGGLPTWLYRRAEEEAAWREIPAQIYLAQTRRAGAAELTIWPETAVWRWWGGDPAWERVLLDLRAARGGALLIGTPLRDSSASVANAAVLLREGVAPQAIHKRRLALLAEARFSPGVATTRLEVAARRWAGVLFCLESVVPQYAREVTMAGSDLIVVLADGSRFGNTSVGRIHADHSSVRAVESGRAVVHAGQHGFTRFIDATGRGTPPLPPFVAAHGVRDVPLYRGVTPYVRWGDWIVLLCAVGVAALTGGAAVARIRKRRRAPAAA